MTFWFIIAAAVVLVVASYMADRALTRLHAAKIVEINAKYAAEVDAINAKYAREGSSDALVAYLTSQAEAWERHMARAESNGQVYDACYHRGAAHALRDVLRHLEGS